MKQRQWKGTRPLSFAAVGAAVAVTAMLAASAAVVAPVAWAAGSGPDGKAPDPSAVLRVVVDNLRGGAMQATYTFTVERPGRVSEYVMELVTDGDRRGHIRVIAPPRDAGQAFLMSGDDLWLYNARLGRSLRLPPSGRSSAFLGSDLSYNDLVGRDLEKDYDPSLTRADGDALILELVPKPGAPTPYGRALIEVDPETLAPRWVDYYDQRGQVVKRLTLSDYLPMGNRRIPLTMVVEDRVREGYRTTARLSDVRFDIPVSEACFTLEALERGCR